MCLGAYGIDNDNNGVGRVRRARGISNDNGGVGKVQGIDDASEESETTTEAAEARRRDRGIYDNNGGVDGGI